MSIDEYSVSLLREGSTMIIQLENSLSTVERKLKPYDQLIARHYKKFWREIQGHVIFALVTIVTNNY